MDNLQIKKLWFTDRKRHKTIGKECFHKFIGILQMFSSNKTVIIYKKKCDCFCLKMLKNVFFAPNSFPFSTTLTFDTTSKPFFVAKNKKKTPGELSPITGPSDRVCFPLVLLLCAYARLYAGLITATATSRQRLNLASHHLVCRLDGESKAD